MRRLVLALPLLATPLLAEADLRLEGPTEAIRLLRPWLPPEGGNPRRLQQQATEILATDGYFSPHFHFTEQDDGDLRMEVEPGERTFIERVDIAIDGPIDPKTKEALLAGWRLPVGKPFRQKDWNSAKQQILSSLLAEEHASAQLFDSEASIDPDSHRAALTARYDAGPRYRFGKLEIEGLQRYTPELVQRYNRTVRPDQPFRAESLGVLQTTLQSTPYFGSVQVSLDTDHAVDHGDGTATAPVLIRVRERAPHKVSFGAGASSNTGARVEANYHTPNLFNQAWELNTGLRLEEKRQTAYADVFLPPDDRYRRNSVGVVHEASDIAGLKLTRDAFGAQTVQQRGIVEQRLSLQWQTEDREISGFEPTTSRALVPNAMWTWRRVDNPLDPREGAVIQGQVGGGSRAFLSDQDFIRVHARVYYYQPLGEHNTLTLRAEAGQTIAPSREHIPQDYLFRAGGTGSIRGYAYQSLGVQQGSAVVGGRYLAIGSAEVTHWLNERWGIATFVDAGDAADHPIRQLAVGYGVGARWKSPAGPLAADIAWGERTGKLQVHFSLAIPF